MSYMIGSSMAWYSGAATPKDISLRMYRLKTACNLLTRKDPAKRYSCSKLLVRHLFDLAYLVRLRKMLTWALLLNQDDSTVWDGAMTPVEIETARQEFASDFVNIKSPIFVKYSGEVEYAPFKGPQTDALIAYYTGTQSRPISASVQLSLAKVRPNLDVSIDDSQPKPPASKLSQTQRASKHSKLERIIRNRQQILAGWNEEAQGLMNLMVRNSLLVVRIAHSSRSWLFSRFDQHILVSLTKQVKALLDEEGVEESLRDPLVRAILFVLIFEGSHRDEHFWGFVRHQIRI